MHSEFKTLESEYLGLDLIKLFCVSVAHWKQELILLSLKEVAIVWPRLYSSKTAHFGIEPWWLGCAASILSQHPSAGTARASDTGLAGGSRRDLPSREHTWWTLTWHTDDTWWHWHSLAVLPGGRRVEVSRWERVSLLPSHTHTHTHTSLSQRKWAAPTPQMGEVIVTQEEKVQSRHRPHSHNCRSDAHCSYSHLPASLHEVLIYTPSLPLLSSSRKPWLLKKSLTSEAAHNSCWNYAYKLTHSHF